MPVRRERNKLYRRLSAKRSRPQHALHSWSASGTPRVCTIAGERPSTLAREMRQVKQQGQSPPGLIPAANIKIAKTDECLTQYINVISRYFMTLRREQSSKPHCVLYYRDGVTVADQGGYGPLSTAQGGTI